MAESSGGLKEIKKDMSPRLVYEDILPDLLKARYSKKEQMRVKLAVSVLNTAFDLLHYAGPMPRFVCGKPFIVNDVTRVGVFSPEGYVGNEDVSTIGVDVSKTPINNIIRGDNSKVFSPEEHAREIVNTMLEEAKHFMDFKFGLDVTQIYLPGDPKYPTQPHEVRTAQFVAKHGPAVSEQFKDYVQYYK